jgi:phage tail sheath protein FI
VPEYLAPGVYVEETSFRSKSIEGVSTSTTAFVGATAKGPVCPRDDTERWNATPELLTSFADYERIYGGFEALDFGAGRVANHMAHAVQGYFNNGGSRLYVMRVFNGALAGAHARSPAVVETAANDNSRIFVRARYPGAYFNTVTVTVQPLFTPISFQRLNTLPDDGIVRSVPPPAAPGAAFASEVWIRVAGAWQTRPAADQPLAPVAAGNIVATRSYQTVSAVVTVTDGSGGTLFTDIVSFDRRHPAWIGSVLAETQTRRSVDLTLPVHLQVGNAIPLTTSAAIDALARGLLGDISTVENPAARVFPLAGGSDGALPASQQVSRALEYLLGLEDISIVAAPGLSQAQAVANELISHAERRRAYRIAVLDTPPSLSPTEVRTYRGQFDSHRAAMYYPWVTVPNPQASVRNLEPAEVTVPPSGFVCGIYARNDIERGVWKSPANEVVRGALRFERDISFGEQEMLNPIGVNCLRPLSGRGLRVWGARTAGSDPEWKYVSVRRYFNYLEASIDRGTQWAVFEPNGERLWDNIRTTVADFLYSEWRQGALLGTKETEAYFVRCDRTTMNQNDLDNGRLVCLVGVAVVKPAEFVIFRVGQKTADART